MNFGIDYIRQISAHAETDSVEFKRSTGQLERGMETLCAFLNGDGGYVLFGMEDDGKIIGQQVADTTKRQIAECIRQFEPFPLVDVDYVPLENGLFVIVLSVVNNREKPYIYKGRAYTRVESTTVAMSQHQYETMLSCRNQPLGRWETQLNANLKISDLDEEEILRTVRVGVEKGRLPEIAYTNDIADALCRMNLMREGQLTNAAFVLYANDANIDYPQCLLRMARFAGTTKDVFMDERRVEGNAFRMLDEAMQFCFKHLSLSGEVKGLIREERLSIPYKALREAVVNALCHREYQTIGGSVGLAIFDDRVEVSNIGHIPDRLDVSNPQEMTLSIPYNPLIAKGFYYRQMFENWGRGIRLMVDECKDAGLQTPVFISSEYQVTAIFHRNDYSEDKSKLSKNQSVKDTVKDTVKDIILNVNDRQMSIIEIMKEQPSVSAEDLALKVGINIRNVKRNLAKLKQDGIIERVGSDKNGYWKVNI